jgi:lysophospholipid acyltransferase (LPLAT)-like uncharacterized protein
VSARRRLAHAADTAVPWLAAGLIRVLGASVVRRHHGDAELRRREREGERFILAFWHRHLLLMPYAYRGRGISVLVSRSRDGELIAKTVARLGIHASRGSSSRGGAAGLRALLRQAREGLDIAFTPDGPRGPLGVVQPGVILAAASTGWPIHPVAVAATRARRLRSWDRFLVPLPFGTVHYVYGEALQVPRDADLGEAAAELARRLDAAETEAERLAGQGEDRREERNAGPTDDWREERSASPTDDRREERSAGPTDAWREERSASPTDARREERSAGPTDDRREERSTGPMDDRREERSAARGRGRPAPPARGERDRG